MKNFRPRQEGAWQRFLRSVGLVAAASEREHKHDDGVNSEVDARTDVGYCPWHPTPQETSAQQEMDLAYLPRLTTEQLFDNEEAAKFRTEHAKCGDLTAFDRATGNVFNFRWNVTRFVDALYSEIEESRDDPLRLEVLNHVVAMTQHFDILLHDDLHYLYSAEEISADTRAELVARAAVKALAVPAPCTICGWSAKTNRR